MALSWRDFPPTPKVKTVDPIGYLQPGLGSLALLLSATDYEIEFATISPPPAQRKKKAMLSENLTTVPNVKGASHDITRQKISDARRLLDPPVERHEIIKQFPCKMILIAAGILLLDLELKIHIGVSKPEIFHQIIEEDG
jgi:hypothetical protein